MTLHPNYTDQLAAVEAEVDAWHAEAVKAHGGAEPRISRMPARERP